MSHSPRVNCPFCGKRLLGERNVRMHVAAVHPDQAAPAATAPQASATDAGHPNGIEHREAHHG